MNRKRITPCLPQLEKLMPGPLQRFANEIRKPPQFDRLLIRFANNIGQVLAASGLAKTTHAASLTSGLK